MITISVISHGHGPMVARLVSTLLTCPEVAQIIITQNLPEIIDIPMSEKVLVVRNPHPLGFASNHNQAFQQCTQTYFCPLNPDIELHCNPFPELLNGIENSKAAVIAPLIKDPSGDIEDSARHFPTISSLFLKACRITDGRYPFLGQPQVTYVAWIAGMFQLFQSHSYQELNGYDSRFYLYYEDVDICVRMWRAGMRVAICPAVFVTHYAQRASHHNLRYFRWHLASMVRYLCKHRGRFPEVPRSG